MNQTELERKLIAAARAQNPSDRVPYAFEKRIMARLAAAPRYDGWSAWAHALPRAAAFCLAVMVSLSAWSYFTASSSSSGSDLSQDFEETVLAAVDQDTAVDAL
jgi:hypothetical protein